MAARYSTIAALALLRFDPAAVGAAAHRRAGWLSRRLRFLLRRARTADMLGGGGGLVSGRTRRGRALA